MKNYYLLLFLIVFANVSLFAQNQKDQNKKPDMNKIRAKALEYLKSVEANKDRKSEFSTENQQSTSDYTTLPAIIRVPGQFEETQAVAMTWPYNNAGTLPLNFTTAQGKIARDLAQKIQLSAKVVIRVQTAADSTAVKNIMIASGSPLTNHTFYIHPVDSYWDRDSGPISFYYGANDDIGFIDMDYYSLEGGQINNGAVITDFDQLNAGGRINDDRIPIALGAKFNYPIYKTPLNNEGGNLIADGLRTMWTSTGARVENTTVYTETYNGNTYTYYNNYPILNNAQYNTLFSNSFRLNSFVEPIAFTCDGGTGHLDIYMKLIDENNLALVDYAQAVNHDDFVKWNTNLQLVQNLNDANGKPIKIKLVPMPLTANGTVQVNCENDQRTYLNGIFVNKNYIMPIMSNPASPSASDLSAITAFQTAMPGYTVQAINAASMYGQGGSLHCITMQIPATNPVFIRHNALAAVQPLAPNYVINTTIKNKSGLFTKFVYYKKSTSPDWIQLPLNTTATADNFTINIPSTGFAVGDIIEYFVEATSNNGKTMAKPIVARTGGAHRFTITAPLSTNNFDKTSNFALSLYPNPTNGNFIIPVSVDSDKDLTIEIFDFLGRNVYSKKQAVANGLHLNEIKNINNFGSTGIYIVVVKLNNLIVSTQKLMVK